jgi:hypothetical protein
MRSVNNGKRLRECRVLGMHGKVIRIEGVRNGVKGAWDKGLLGTECQ